jgi:mRNA interferase MazF
VEVGGVRHSLDRDSVVLLEQIRTIDKQRLQEKIAHLDEEIMARVDHALSISLGLLPLD